VRHQRAWRAAIAAAALCVLVPAATHAQITAAARTVAPPAELAAPVKALLGPATTVSAGTASLEFWWVTALPVSGSGAFEWSQVAEGTLVGAVRVGGAFKEIRGKTVKPGVYTLRLGLQPQNGDHLGASPFREYLLLSPAAVDADPKPLGFDGTVALSKQTVGASHPAALSLDPPVATAAALTAVTNELDHHGVVIELKTSAGGSFRFGLILIGLIEH
jgi:hypothetical protein